MKVLINTLEASDKQVLDLATETLYSQQVEMVLYFQLLVFCFRGTSLLKYKFQIEWKKSNTNLTDFLHSFQYQINRSESTISESQSYCLCIFEDFLNSSGQKSSCLNKQEDHDGPISLT